MKINIINLFVCPDCRKGLSLSTYKRIKDRIIEGKLKCEKCCKEYYIKDGIVCFPSCDKKQSEKRKKDLRRITIKQEIPRKWMRLFPEKELSGLKKEWNFLLSAIKKDKAAIHLDFATGTGRFLRNIVPKTKGEIVALDNGYLTCQELQYFLKKIKKYNRLSIVCADARKMPFKNNAFASVSSWHGFDEPKISKGIKEAKRALKNNAYFAASGIFYQKGSKSFSIARKNHIDFISKEAIINALRNAGFRKIEHKIFFQGKWNEKKSYLPVFGDFYSVYGVKVKK